MSNHPVIDLGITSNLGSPNKGCGCFGIIIALVLLMVSVYFLGQDSNTKTNNSSVTLEWLPACGSSARSGSVWYSVMGNRQALKTVKEKYCGDAFITSRGNLQAASFTSKAEAEQFASLLTKVTGYKFWVSY
jgi:serine/threonine-protein kinase